LNLLRLTCVLLCTSLVSGQSPLQPVIPNPPDAQAGVAAANPAEPLVYLGQFSSDQDLKQALTRSQRTVNILSGRKRKSVKNSLAFPQHIAVDSAGRIIVTDPLAKAVHIFDLENKKYSRIEDWHRIPNPMGVAVDNADNIYITDSSSAVIVVYDRRGNFHRTITGLKNEAGTLFGSPGAIAIDRKNNHIYVVDPARNRVYALNMRGEMLAKVGKGSGATGPGEFNHPSDVAVKDGEVYVADSGNLRIQVFSSNGEYRREIRLAGKRVAPTQGMGLAINSRNELIVTDAMPNQIEVITNSGQPLGSIGGTGDQAGQFNWPGGVWADSSDRVYVADSNNHRVQVFRRIEGKK